MAITINDRSSASLPGRLKPDYLRWVMHRPQWPMIWAGAMLVTLGTAIFIHWIAWISVAAIGCVNALYWVRIKEHFAFGCINPGVVLSTSPCLVAAVTDLSKGHGEYLAVKIVRWPLRAANGMIPEPGRKVATIALYQEAKDENGNSIYPYWVNFDPIPVDCVTKNPKELKRIIDSIDAADWQELTQCLHQIEQPYEEGLYELWEDEDESSESELAMNARGDIPLVD